MPHLNFAPFSLTATDTVISSGHGHIYIYAVKLVVSAALTVKWQEVAPDGAVTDLEGGQAYPANGGYVEFIPPPDYLFFTRIAYSLQLNISGAGTAAGRVSYFRS